MKLVNRYALAPLARRLVEAIGKLAAWEQQAEDLAYPEGDPRREIPLAEMPREYVTLRSALQANVVLLAALVAGEEPIVAKIYADDPASQSNPYNIDLVRCAVAIMHLEF